MADLSHPSLKLLAALALQCLAAAAAAQDYRFDFLSNGGTRYLTPTGINQQGRVVGTVGETHQPEAVVWNAHQPNRPPIGLPPNAECCTYTATWGAGINNLGQVVGQDTYRAALWTGNTRATLLPQLAGHSQSYALAVNDGGQAVGYTWLDNGHQNATLWDGSGSARNLGTLGGQDSYAYAINEAGTIAGASQRAGSGTLHATVWTDGAMLDFGAADGLASEAADINDRGVVVGTRADRAVRWDEGVATFLDGVGTRATAINNAGLAVGYYYEEFSDTPMHALLWSGTRAIDLNSFLSAADRDAGWSLEVATDINDQGWIVGRAYNSQGLGGAPFVLSIPAIPEPASLSLLLAGLGLLGGAATRARRRDRQPAHTAQRIAAPS